MSIVVPFGPQHPVLPEPLQLRLEIVDETVVSALPVIGYVHRGLERLAEQKDFQQDTYLIEHICGICSFMHSTTYCTGIEEIMNIEIPERAKYLRVAWSEMHRIHSHLLALGLLADAFGFESLFYQIWRTREHIMDAMEYTTGGRVMLSAACVGGVRKDINEEQPEKSHIWNMVKIEDVWFNIDITWDYDLTEDDISYKYFLIDNDTFYQNHNMQPNMPNK